MIKLTNEEQMALLALTNHSGYKVLLKQFDALAQAQELTVLVYDLEAGSDRALALKRAQAQGARKLIKDLEQTIKHLKAKKES